MATSVAELDVVMKRNVRYQVNAVDDVGEVADKIQVGSAPSPTGVSATSEDYVEERYKVDRRKLEQMILGKCKQTITVPILCLAELPSKTAMHEISLPFPPCPCLSEFPEPSSPFPSLPLSSHPTRPINPIF